MNEDGNKYTVTPDGGRKKVVERTKISGGEIDGCVSVDVSAVDYVPTKKINGVFIGTGGNIKIDLAESGTSVIYKNLADGSFLPAHITKIYTADTTASDIVAYWS